MGVIVTKKKTKKQNSKSLVHVVLVYLRIFGFQAKNDAILLRCERKMDASFVYVSQLAWQA